MNTLNSNLKKPRKGLLGSWDMVVGPGMSFQETWICLIPTLLATVLIPIYAIINHFGWNIWQLLIMAFLAFDLVGGAIVNVSETTKCWHHSPQHNWRYHYGFIAIHLHPFLVAWLYGGSWSEATIAYGYLLIATPLILFVPCRLQKSIAITLYLGGLVLSHYLFQGIEGMGWFLPVYFLKLFVSYLPEDSNRSLS